MSDFNLVLSIISYQRVGSISNSFVKIECHLQNKTEQNRDNYIQDEHTAQLVYST